MALKHDARISLVGPVSSPTLGSFQPLVSFSAQVALQLASLQPSSANFAATGFWVRVASAIVKALSAALQTLAEQIAIFRQK
jgi:hypothetical protein